MHLLNKFQGRAMPPADVLACMWTAFCISSAFNGPQPLLPSIASEFGTSSSTTSLVISCTLFPLGLSPIFYGVILSRFSLLRTLAAALAVYFASLLPPVLGCGWHMLLAGRLLQGFALPACMLCMMTYLSTRFEGGEMQRFLGWYASANVCGGFMGRLMAGAVDSMTGSWRLSFAVMAACLLSTLPAVRLLRQGRGGFRKVNLRALPAALRQKGMPRLLLIAPCIVFANYSVLSILPFRLRDVSPGITPFEISLVYLGIILCSLTGLLSMRIIRTLGSEMRALTASILVYVAFLPLLLIPSPPALFFILIGLNFGYAFLYAALPGILARYSTAEKSVVNGLFLTAYYLSGAFGSYLPVIIYEHLGFTPYLAAMAALAAVALGIVLSLRGITLDSGRTD